MGFRRFVRNTMAKSGYVVSPAQSTDRVKALLARMRPVRTDFDLIRIGASTDGGYLIPDDLDGIAACFSPGVGYVATFEHEIAERGIPCFLADASVAGPPVDHPLIGFEKLFLDTEDRPGFVRLDSWIERKYGRESGDLLLEMDIEGAEWPILLDASSDTLRRFRIIVLELHDLSRVLEPFGLRIVSAVMDKLLKDFHVVHVHPNNSVPIIQYAGNAVPEVVEMTLLRKDRSPAHGFASTFPHPLDADCVPGKRHVVLPPSLSGLAA